MSEKIVSQRQIRDYRRYADLQYSTGNWELPEIFNTQNDLHRLYFEEFETYTHHNGDRDYMSVHDRHHVHTSVDPEKPEMIAFTRTFADGVRDRQVRVKLGRYLAQTFGSKLSPERIAELVNEHSINTQTRVKWHIAMTPSRIETVYRRGPSSCMSKDIRYYNTDIHPTRIYGAGDLGVAFCWRGGRITARALVWPERKVFGRIYGDERRLEGVLRESGYMNLSEHRDHIRNDPRFNDTLTWRDWGFNGARLLRIEEFGGHIVAPYMDDDYGLDFLHRNVAYANSGFLMMTECFDLACSETNGLAQQPGEDCSHCGDYTPEDELTTRFDGDRICDHCLCHDHFYCEHNGEIYPDSEAVVTHDHQTISREAYEDHYFTCFATGEVYPHYEMNTSEHDGEDRCDDAHQKHLEDIEAMKSEEENEQEAA